MAKREARGLVFFFYFFGGGVKMCLGTKREQNNLKLIKHPTHDPYREGPWSKAYLIN